MEFAFDSESFDSHRASRNIARRTGEALRSLKMANLVFDPAFDFIDHLTNVEERQLKMHMSTAEKSLATAFQLLALNKQISEERAASVVHEAVEKFAEITNTNLRH